MKSLAIAAMVAAVSAGHLQYNDLQLVGFETRNDFTERTSTPTRGVFGARDWIRAQFEQIARASGGRMRVQMDTFVQPKSPYTPRAVTESSIIATLRGSEPGRVYVMSSHYDDCDGSCVDPLGSAPGADDNGSGTAAVIEAARVMSHTSFRGTIIFAVFDGEELGLWGSEHFARELKAHGIHVIADLNDDIIGTPNAPAGTPDASRVRIFSEALPPNSNPLLVDEIGNENDAPSRELARFVARVDAAYVPSMTGVLIYRADRFLRGGDQESFTAQGFPAIRFVEMHEDFRHQHQNVRIVRGVQYGDLPQYLDWTYLANVTRMNVAALATLALGPGEPQNVNLLAAHLTNRSTLHWSPAADAVRYEIVWRDTTSPVWEHVIDVGNRTQATVPISHDNEILGVRSVGTDGLRSPAVYPMPVRE